MPRKNLLPLSERIGVFYLDGVWNDLPENKKTTVKARLVEWQGLAEALENGKALAEAEGEIVALQTQKQVLEAKCAELEERGKALETQAKDYEALYNQATEAVRKFQMEEKASKEQACTQQEEIERLKSENAFLKKMGKESAPGYKIPQFKPPPFADPSKAILYVLAQQAYAIDINGVAVQSAVSPAVVRHYLEDLKSRELVEGKPDPMVGGIGWRLTQKGDAYIVKENLAQPPPPPKTATGVLGKKSGLERYTGLT